MRKLTLFIIASVILTLQYAYADIRSAVGDLQYTIMMIDYGYVDTVNVNKLAEEGIRAMLKQLDPHSTYLTADEMKAMNEDLGGNFDGIGIQYQMERDTLLVIQTIVGGPSEKVGIMAGDQVIFVNDTLIAGKKLSTRDIQKKLRGPKGTVVKVSVQRGNEKIDFNITRDKIPVHSIDASYMAAPGVGYIKISRFAQTTPDELRTAMSDLEKLGMQDVIIDLQSNGGGYLQSAVDMAEMFLDKDKLIVYTQGRNDSRKEFRSRKGHPFSGRVVVMLNEESASSSEIFAGALQDHDRAVIVGRRSFGKGLVQRPVELPGGAMIRLTIAHYYTPCGRCIQKPFERGGKEDYSLDIKQRYDKGEFFSADSIHFADSLQYHTSGGRTVYGGGGIMPDVFVPLDTTRINKTHRALIAKGTYNHFVLDYFRQHQKALKRKYKTFDEFNQKFIITDQMISDLIEAGRKDSVTIDSLHTLPSATDMLKLQIKANLANDLFETGSYMRIMNTSINTYQKALDIITNEKRYREHLTRAYK